MTDAPAGALVTGATGFLGRALVRRLQAEGRLVRGIARQARGATPHDITPLDLSSAVPPSDLFTGIDTVFHLAAKTHDLRDATGVEREYQRINVVGTRHLLEGIRGTGVRRLVFASSVKAVGEGGSAVVDERVEPTPTTPYGRSKLEAERVIRSTAAERGFTAVCLRFPLMYGPGQRGNLQRMIRAIDAGRFPPLPEVGTRRSLLHVDNAVDALMLAATHPAPGPVYYVADRRAYSTRELYDAIRRALGLPPVTWSVPAPVLRMTAWTGDLARRVLGRRVGFDSDAFDKLLGPAEYSPELIARELGYRPAVDFVSALPALVADHRRAGHS